MSDARICPECGTPFKRPRSSAVFCCEAHTQAFINRRRLRGAAIVELHLHHRFNRGPARAAGVLEKMNMLLDAWRQEDARLGRQSMLDLDDAIARIRAPAEAPEAR